MGIIGPGGRSRAFLGDSRPQFLAACDVDSQRCTHAKNIIDQKHQNRDCAEYRDFRELLQRANIDAVVSLLLCRRDNHVPAYARERHNVRGHARLDRYGDLRVSERELHPEGARQGDDRPE